MRFLNARRGQGILPQRTPRTTTAKILLRQRQERREESYGHDSGESQGHRDGNNRNYSYYALLMPFRRAPGKIRCRWPLPLPFSVLSPFLPFAVAVAVTKYSSLPFSVISAISVAKAVDVAVA